MVMKSGSSSFFLCKHLYLVQCLTEVLFTLQVLLINNDSHMAAAIADCFSALKSSRKKSPDCVFNKLVWLRTVTYS